MLTEVEILTDVINPQRGDFSASVAREVLNLHYSDRTQARIRDLLSSNNAGTISADERSDLDKYLRVGQFIDLIQAKARLSLAACGDDAP
jgi:hypothetical protein